MLKKDKNSLSVALKSSKKENTDNAKAFEKKLLINEKKVEDLSEFKSKKSRAKREEKLIQKEEMKKAKKNIDELNKAK